VTEQEGDIIKYRFNRAFATLNDARVLAQANRWESCVNRLYYACFYAVSALLARHGMESSKHAGILSLFNLYFVKTGKVSKETAEIYNDLFDDRHESDYTDFVSFTGEYVIPQVHKVEAFIETIRLLLE
jgi:uncharacterized protein (UPF0332 family)